MRRHLLSILTAFLFNLMSLALILGIVLYRTDGIVAQSDSAKFGDSALVPRHVEVAGADDDDDDADGDGDPPTDNDGTDSDGYDTPPGEEDTVVTYTIRAGDTLFKIARRLGIPYSVLKAQDDTPSLIHPGQKFVYRPSDRVDSSIPLTDDDGTDSDGYNTPPPSTDFDGVSTLPLTTDNDETDNDGYDTQYAGPAGAARAAQANQPRNQSYTDNDGVATTPLTTDNDGTDSDGVATSQLTSNDGTDSDGVATSQLTSNDGTDSDGIDTTGQQNDTPDTADSADSNSGVSS